MWCATTASCTCTAPFGRAGRAAGEVQQRHVFGPCRHGLDEFDAAAIAAARPVVPGGGVGEESVRKMCSRLGSSLRQGSILRR